jgi:predicted PurR-regulated permease PerM
VKKWLDSNHFSLIASITLAGLLIVSIYFIILNIDVLFKLLSDLGSVLTPFMYGLIFAFLMGPIVTFVEQKALVSFKWKKSTKRIVSVVLTLLITIEIIVLFFSFIIPQLITSLSSISEKLPQYIIVVEDLLGDWLIRYRVENDWVNLVLDSSEDLLVNFLTTIQSYIPLILDYSWQFTKMVFNLLLGIAIAMYVLIDKERFSLQAKKVLYVLAGQKSGDYLVDLSRLSSNMVHRFILGKMLDSLIIGFICYIGMLILGLSYPVLLSVIIGVTNMIPVFGPFIGAIPGTLILILVDPFQALWFVLFIIVLQQFDGNYLGPRILGDSMGLPSLWIMFAIIVGGGYFGVIGMFLGVPIFAVIYIVSKKLVANKLERESIKIKT